MSDEIKKELPWWKYEISASSAEDTAHLIMEYGASGAEIISDSKFICYFQGEVAAAEELQDKISNLDAIVVSRELFANENWVQKCEEVWKPVQVGSLNLIPVLTTESTKLAHKYPTALDAELHDIYLIPGTGFGTGHHESTRLALELLHSFEVRRLAPEQVLDVGTGNGVLAFAAFSLYQSSVDALDTDPAAIENANDNLKLNPNHENIQFFEQELDVTFGLYDLILANIYAEVLTSLEQELFSHLKGNGLIILSGLTSDTTSQVVSAFTHEWKQVQKLTENDWVSLMYKKETEEEAA